jgi:hypothetical protein
MDGSDLIGLELAIHHTTESIIEPPLQNQFVHGWDNLGLGDDMEREGNVLKIHRLVQKCERGLPSYAWMCSFLLDKNTSQIIFPWAIFLQIAKTTNYSTRKSAFCAVLEQYAENNPIGPDDLFGIKKVCFDDATFFL